MTKQETIAKYVAAGMINGDEFDVAIYNQMIKIGKRARALGFSDSLHHELRGKFDVEIDGVTYCAAILVERDQSIYDVCECGGSYRRDSFDAPVCSQCGAIHSDWE